MYIARFCRYISRTITWSPAWEGILTGPDYRTDVGEWSKNRFEEVEKAERHEESIRLAESGARERASEQRAEQNAQRVAKLEEMLRRMGVDPDTALDDVNVSQGASTEVERG